MMISTTINTTVQNGIAVDLTLFMVRRKIVRRRRSKTEMVAMTNNAVIILLIMIIFIIKIKAVCDQ